MSYSILHIDDKLTWRGGQSQVLHLLNGLKEREHHVELVSQPKSILGERARQNGIPMHDVRMRGEADFVAAHQISRIIRAGRYDIVHTHTAHAHTLGAMACAFNRLPKCVVHRRVDFPINAGLLGLARLKYLFRVDAYIAISRAIRDVLLAGGVRPEKIFVVHSGSIPPPTAADKDVRRELGILPDEKVVGTVGALVDHKGQRYLIEAAPLVLKKIPKAIFVIVGDGELETELRHLVSSLRLEKAVIFTGFQPHPGSYMEAFDVYTAPSHLEGLNNSIVEAMMMGRPVVGARAGGIPELIEHEKSGLLVPAKDPAALAEAILDLLQNPQKADRLALAGQKRASQAFTTDKMVEGNIRVYDHLLKK